MSPKNPWPLGTIATDAQIRSILQETIKSLVANLRLKKVFLYGSYARGKSSPHSDVDLLVLAEDFDGKDLLQKIETEVRASRELDPRIEIIGASLKEFAQASPASFFAYIKRRGKCIYKQGKFLL